MRRGFAKLPAPLFARRPAAGSGGPLIVLLAVALLAACEPKPQPVGDFVLPDGDAERGRQVFVEFKCYNCHSIPDVEMPERATEPPFELVLATRTNRVRKRGDILTAIVNPDHEKSPKFLAEVRAAGKDADLSPMPAFLEQMSVAELIDLAEFLHQQYARLQPYAYRDPAK